MMGEFFGKNVKEALEVISLLKKPLIDCSLCKSIHRMGYDCQADGDS